MALNTSIDGNINTIRLGKTFDFSVQAEFRKCYESVPPTARFVVDFTQTEYMDSSALGMLLLLRDYAGSDRSNIELVHCNRDIRNILEISNFQKLFMVK